MYSSDSAAQTCLIFGQSFFKIILLYTHIHMTYSKQGSYQSFAMVSVLLKWAGQEFLAFFLRQIWDMRVLYAFSLNKGIQT